MSFKLSDLPPAAPAETFPRKKRGRCQKTEKTPTSAHTSFPSEHSSSPSPPRMRFKQPRVVRPRKCQVVLQAPLLPAWMTVEILHYMARCLVYDCELSSEFHRFLVAMAGMNWPCLTWENMALFLQITPEDARATTTVLVYNGRDRPQKCKHSYAKLCIAIGQSLHAWPRTIQSCTEIPMTMLSVLRRLRVPLGEIFPNVRDIQEINAGIISATGVAWCAITMCRGVYTATERSLLYREEIKIVKKKPEAPEPKPIEAPKDVKGKNEVNNTLATLHDVVKHYILFEESENEETPPPPPLSEPPAKNRNKVELLPHNDLDGYTADESLDFLARMLRFLKPKRIVYRELNDITCQMTEDVYITSNEEFVFPATQVVAFLTARIREIQRMVTTQAKYHSATGLRCDMNISAVLDYIEVCFARRRNECVVIPRLDTISEMIRFRDILMQTPVHTHFIVRTCTLGGVSYKRRERIENALSARAWAKMALDSVGRTEPIRVIEKIKPYRRRRSLRIRKFPDTYEPRGITSTNEEIHRCISSLVEPQEYGIGMVNECQASLVKIRDYVQDYGFPDQMPADFARRRLLRNVPRHIRTLYDNGLVTRRDLESLTQFERSGNWEMKLMEDGDLDIDPLDEEALYESTLTPMQLEKKRAADRLNADTHWSYSLFDKLRTIGPVPTTGTKNAPTNVEDNPQESVYASETASGASVQFLNSLERSRNKQNVMSDIPDHTSIKTRSGIEVQAKIHPLSISAAVYTTISAALDAAVKLTPNMPPCDYCHYHPGEQFGNMVNHLYHLTRACIGNSVFFVEFCAAASRCLICSVITAACIAVSVTVQKADVDVALLDVLVDKDTPYHRRLVRRFTDRTVTPFIPVGEMIANGIELFRNVKMLLKTQNGKKKIHTRDARLSAVDVMRGKQARDYAKRYSPVWYRFTGVKKLDWCVLCVAGAQRMDILTTLQMLSQSSLMNSSDYTQPHIMPRMDENGATFFVLHEAELRTVQRAIIPLIMTYLDETTTHIKPCPQHPQMARNLYKGTGFEVYMAMNWMRRMLYTSNTEDDVVSKKVKRSRRGRMLPPALAGHYRMLIPLLNSMTFIELYMGLTEVYKTNQRFSAKPTGTYKLWRILGLMKDLEKKNPSTGKTPRFRRLMQAMNVGIRAECMKLEKKRRGETRPSSHVDPETGDVEYEDLYNPNTEQLPLGVDYEEYIDGQIDFGYVHFVGNLKAFVAPVHTDILISQLAVDVLEFILCENDEIRLDHPVAMSVLIEMRTNPKSRNLALRCQVEAFKMLMHTVPAFKHWHCVPRLGVFEPAKRLAELQAQKYEGEVPAQHEWFVWKLYRQLKIYDVLMMHTNGDTLMTRKLFCLRVWNINQMRMHWQNAGVNSSKAYQETIDAGNSNINIDDTAENLWWQNIDDNDDPFGRDANVNDADDEVNENEPDGDQDEGYTKERWWCECMWCKRLSFTSTDPYFVRMYHSAVESDTSNLFTYTRRKQYIMSAVAEEYYSIPQTTRLFPDYSLPAHYAFYRLACDSRVPLHHRKIIFTGMVQGHRRCHKKLRPSKNWKVTNTRDIGMGVEIARQYTLKLLVDGIIPASAPSYAWGDQFEIEQIMKQTEQMRNHNHELSVCIAYARRLLKNPDSTLSDMKKMDAEMFSRYTAFLARTRQREYEVNRESMERKKEQEDAYRREIEIKLLAERSDAEHSIDTVRQAEKDSAFILEQIQNNYCGDDVDYRPLSVESENLMSDINSHNTTLVTMAAHIFDTRMRLRFFEIQKKLHSSQVSYRMMCLKNPYLSHPRNKPVDIGQSTDVLIQAYSNEEIRKDGLSAVSTLTYFMTMLECMSYMSHNLPRWDESGRMKYTPEFTESYMDFGKTSRAYFTQFMAEKMHGIQEAPALVASNVPLPMAYGQTNVLHDVKHVPPEPLRVYTDNTLFPVWPTRIIDPLKSVKEARIPCRGGFAVRAFTSASPLMIVEITATPIVYVDADTDSLLPIYAEKSPRGAMYGKKNESRVISKPTSTTRPANISEKKARRSPPSEDPDEFWIDLDEYDVKTMAHAMSPDVDMSWWEKDWVDIPGTPCFC